MVTLSVPLSDDTHNSMTNAIKQGFGRNYADIARSAILKYLEDLAVEAVLKAQKEPSLSGNLDELAKKL